jgi:hydrogenase nickel incorporation protein HypA/HybF
MHELSVTESILEIALRHANQANASRISDLYLVIGQLSSIVDDSVEFYWDLIAKDTIAEGAKLHFRRLPTQLKCLDCSFPFQPENGNFTCPKCQSTKIKILSGDEFYMEAIEVDS